VSGLGSIAEAAAIQSDAYSAIFSADSPEKFKLYLNDYLSQNLADTSIVSSYLIHESGATANERSLVTDYYIQYTYFFDNFS
jgi:hypothetical protein